MPRAPSSYHSAISIAPVSEAATTPTRQSAGTPKIARERAITSWMRASPAAERCERPTSAADSAAGDQPGRFAQGPEEKQGLRGRRDGFIKGCSLQIGCHPLGGRVPRRNLWARGGRVNAAERDGRAAPPGAIGIVGTIGDGLVKIPARQNWTSLLA